MDQGIITCPRCGAEIPITDALRESIRKGMEEEYRVRLKDEIERRLKIELERREAEIEEKYRLMQDQLEVKSRRLDEAIRGESEERRKRMELEETLKQKNLEIERRVDEERKRIESELRKGLEMEFNLKNREIQERNEELSRRVQELQRKLEQGSQQLQGEALEIELESFLRNAFPMDVIEPVPVGIRGPDIIHRVKSPAGFDAGSIAWEAKRTKEWNDQWISKLKDDLLNYKVEVGIIVSSALPKDIKSFGIKDGIFISNFESVKPLANIIRSNLIEIARQRRIGESTDESKEILYRYFTSQQFRQRIESVVTSIRKMREDLDSERRSMERLWARREKEIERAELGVISMFGELQGIVGPTLQDIKELNFPQEKDE